MIFLSEKENFLVAFSDINDLSRQLGKKMDIFNYYFSFLKLIAVWNKVSECNESFFSRFFLASCGTFS